MRLIKTALVALSAVAVICTASVVVATSAFALNQGNNWCLGSTSPGECINAWGGGPWVKLYTGGDTANGDYIWDHGIALPAQYLILSNQGSNWFGNCIGDAYNDPNDARASLDPCPGQNGGSGSGDGWGTHILRDTTVCSNGWVAFKDLHWGGWIGPENEGNGAQFYLNKPSPWCYRADPPVG